MIDKSKLKKMITEILKFDEDQLIQITTEEGAHTYEVRKEQNNFLMLWCVDQTDIPIVWGDRYMNYIDIIYSLMQDCTSGIISDVKVIEKDKN